MDSETLQATVITLSTLTIGLVLLALIISFLLWRFQRLYEMMITVLNEVRTTVARLRTECLANNGKQELINTARTRDLKNLQQAVDVLQQAVNEHE